MIFHLVPKSEWEANPASAYIPAAFAKDGFIHCTGDEVGLLAVANAFYKGVAGDVLALSIDEQQLTSPLKWEAPSHPAPAAPPAAPTEISAAPPAAPSTPAATPAAPSVPPPEVKAEYGAESDLPPSAVPAAQPPANVTPNVAPDARPAGLPTQFPHIYGPLNRDAVVVTRKFVRTADGTYLGFEPAMPTPSKPQEKPGSPDDLLSQIRGKTPSQLANELLDATDNFSEALNRYKDKLEARKDLLDDEINKKL